MSEQSTLTWSWLKRIDKKLSACDEIPLMREFEPFPLSLLAEKIRSTLKLQTFSIKALEAEWKEETALYKDIGTPYETFTIQPSGINGALLCVISKGDLALIASEILKLPLDNILSLPAPYQEQIKTFLATETIMHVNALRYAGLSFSFSATAPTEHTPQLTQDIYIEIGTTHVRLRMIITNAFRTSSIESTKATTSKTPSKQKLSTFPLSLSLEAGRTHLSTQELLSLRPGDFLLIDHPIYEPSNKSPNGIISIAGKPVFKVQLQEKQAIILEIPPYNEVYGTMTNKFDIQEHDEDHHEDDEDSVEEQDEAHEEDDDDDMFAPFAEDEAEDDIEEEIEGAEDSEETAPATEEQEEHSEEEPLEEQASQELPTVEEAPQEQSIVSPSGEVHLNQIPMTVKIELARVSMTADKLFELQPGNMIDFHTSSNIAHLVIDDTIIGKGEILKIGDNVGIRIIEIASHD